MFQWFLLAIAIWAVLLLLAAAALTIATRRRDRRWRRYRDSHPGYILQQDRRNGHG